MTFVMTVFLLGLFSDKVVFSFFKVSGGRGLSSVFISVAKDFPRGGRLGPTGVDLRVWSRWSMEIPEDLAADREVFIVLIWPSTKPLDLGQKGDEVM